MDKSIVLALNMFFTNNIFLGNEKEVTLYIVSAFGSNN